MEFVNRSQYRKNLVKYFCAWPLYTVVCGFLIIGFTYTEWAGYAHSKKGEPSQKLCTLYPGIFLVMLDCDSEWNHIYYEDDVIP